MCTGGYVRNDHPINLPLLSRKLLFTNSGIRDTDAVLKAIEKLYEQLQPLDMDNLCADDCRLPK